MQFSPSPIKPTITMSDLEKIDIRVGTIKSVDDVEGSSKLIKLLVDFGNQQRTILVGMKEERANAQRDSGNANVVRRKSGAEKDGGPAFRRDVI